MSLRIAIVGGARFGTAQPFAGGMEAHTGGLADGLRARGHRVTVFAGRPGTTSAGDQAIWGDWAAGGHSRLDMSVDPGEIAGEHLAYERTMLGLRDVAGRGELDHVHVSSCHHLPVAMAGALEIPVTATLHSPPTDLLGMAYAEAGLAGGAPVPIAVSRSLAVSYLDRLGWLPAVIPNGVNLGGWPVGSGTGGYAMWCGRLVAEKAPQLAIDAALEAGLPIRLAGPAHDRDFFEAEIAPRLGPGVSYAGHLDSPTLARVIGGAAVCLVTPAWPEPFGLVAIEAMACGTPVAAVGLGALPDLIDASVGALSDGTVAGLAAAAREAIACDRGAVRARAEERFDLELMLDRYEELFTSGGAAALEEAA